MDKKQLDSLWKICGSAEDREAIMVFLANAASSQSVHGPNLPEDNEMNKGLQPLTSAYSKEIQLHAFQKIFCCEDLDWKILGVNAYKSFQSLFITLKTAAPSFLDLQKPALDALWRISLQTGNDDVASNSMRDLLYLYGTLSEAKRKLEVSSQNAWVPKPTDEIPFDSVETFADKIFSSLENARAGLRSGDKLSVRSAERCVQILSAAIASTVKSEKFKSQQSTIHFNPASVRGHVTKVDDIVRVFPHGLRGQSCNRTISILARRSTSRQSQNERFLMRVHPLESLRSINNKVGQHCKHDRSLVRPISFNGGRSNLNIESEHSAVDSIGIVEGSEVVFLLCNNNMPQNQSKYQRREEQSLQLSMSDIFGGNGRGPSDGFFQLLIDVLEALTPSTVLNSSEQINTSKLVWELLQSVPSNERIVGKVREAAQCSLWDSDDLSNQTMSVDMQSNLVEWKQLLNPNFYQKAVYVMQVIDSFLLPSIELIEQVDKQKALAPLVQLDSEKFRQAFIESGGFDALIEFFNRPQRLSQTDSHVLRRERAFAFRIIKCCVFGRSKLENFEADRPLRPLNVDDIGATLLSYLSNSKSFYTNLAAAIVLDEGVGGHSICDALSILQVLFKSYEESPTVFASIPNELAEKFMILLLMWESKSSLNAVTLWIGRQIRKTTEEIILSSPTFSAHSLPWLIKALDTKIDPCGDASEEYFSVLIRLVELYENVKASGTKISRQDLTTLSTVICSKLSKCYRPDGASVEYSSVILCGCLKLIQVLININATSALEDGVSILNRSFNTTQWTSSLSQSANDTLLVCLMGIIFDAFLSDGKSSSDLAVCFDNQSRRLGFDLISSRASACSEGLGYLILSSKFHDIISSSSPFLRHRWGQNISGDENGSMNALANKSQYSGLKNQGCTCYMNSVLQQLFMMPEFRKNLCSATLPSVLRSSGGNFAAKGPQLIGKNVMMYWENGSTYEATIENYDDSTSMHTIKYLLPKDAFRNRENMQSSSKLLLDDLPDEFVLTEGRPGKETGVYKIINKSKNKSLENGAKDITKSSKNDLQETEDEIAFRRLLEEFQRTFVHLDKGSRGRVFDPRSLVEASGCLKLEFEIWQQNDASEFAMKLLDKLEVPLKRWSPDNFRYLEQTFRVKQTKQKICRECGLKTNIEENLMNIDCQIRGKSDIHEALSAMCGVEYMEGDNKVYCENCKRNTDTILRTAISALPDMLILSLKRFDLDYNTFETVKLNSRCAFDECLNMKKYSLEGVEAMENASNMNDEENNDDLDEKMVDPLSELPDEDYEYKLAGVLVHHGVAQGGHYYSFIRDRTIGSDAASDKWYRFDDDEVSQFDPSQIEIECFGGKVKKETKWPNGQINTVETEQLANALMLFYEKVKRSNARNENISPKDTEMISVESTKDEINMTSGFQVYDGDVQRSNSVHRSHAFLLDNEFQRFVRNILNVSLSHNNRLMESPLNASPQSELSSDDLNTFLISWREPILELCISYFFDILLHSVDNTTLNDWTNALNTALASSNDGAKWLVHQLAERTETVNENWLRIFTSDCPEQMSRQSAMKIISTALRRVITQQGEISALQSWTQAWLQQIINTGLIHVGRSDEQRPLPTSLIGDMQNLEDVNKIGNSVASSIGIIISYLCMLLELAPRTWQYNAELCLLLTEMTVQSTKESTEIVRAALRAAQIPARLIALILRDKAPILLQLAFPGASLSYELSENISKPITSATAHIFPQHTNNPGIVSNTSIGSPSPSDNINMLEALASIIGIEGARNAQLIVEVVEGKGRTSNHLTDKAKEALSVVFNECASSDGSMDQKDIFNYMKLCGFDAMTASQQRINNIIAKYGTYGADSKHLPVDGFLNYYRDTSQSNSMQIQSDLHTFGFRPDLTRCSKESRQYSSGNRDLQYSTFETVANDVFSMMNSNYSIGTLAEVGLSSIQLYHNSYFIDSNVTEYLLSWYGLYCQDVRQLIDNSLKSLYQAQAWGNETVQICIMILMVVASVPGENQKQRISYIMQSQERLDASSNIGSGLLIVGKELSLSQGAQQYRADYNNHRTMLERYIEAVKEMQKVRVVSEWMSENRQLWAWIDQAAENQHGNGRDYRRGEYHGRRDRDGLQHVSGGTMYDHNNSDSDPNGDMNYSDESDGDYAGHEYRPGVVVVKGAGMSEVNGVYLQAPESLTMWQNSPKLECIRTNKENLLYSDVCLVTTQADDNETPHEGAWEPNSKESGLAPAPTVEWRSDDFDSGSQRVSSNDEYDHIVDDSNYDDDMEEPQS